MKEKSLKDLFHRVGQVLPEEQELITIPPDTIAREALELMQKHNFSQIPVTAGSEVLGVFSHRSFSKGIILLGKKEQDPASLPAEVFIEDMKFARITAELSVLFDELDMKDALLVGSESRLQGIITAVDALRYFYSVASPYVMLREIELSIRELMRASVNATELRDCIDKCLREHYEGKSLRSPSCLEEMSFNDYLMILRFKGFWDYFKNSFGGSYTMANAKLAPLPNLRNDVFHFRRDLTIEEYDILRDCRDWLLKRIRKLDATKGLDKND